eukprot:m.65040 g.65040  ORF g.65040 m.65040 type:complete len:748 (-) comp7302_c0_seq2:178-2421(-)
MELLTEWLFILDICIMALAARLVSGPLNRMGLPRIVGDIIAGCLLGPTILQNGVFTPFPTENREVIHMLGYIGLILASMSSGANFDKRILKGRYGQVLLFSTFNIFVTFGSAFGAAAIIPSTDGWRGPKYEDTSFQFYFGSALCATSLPMTFLILDDLKLTNNLAKFTIGTSTMATIYLFTLVSVASSLESADGNFHDGIIPFRIGMLFVMFIVLHLLQVFWHWGFEKYGRQSWFGRTSTDQSLLIIVLGLVCSVVTERLGYTFVLGAYAAGAFLPYDDEIRGNFSKLIKWGARWLMLPLFFLSIGLNFDLRHIGGTDWGYIVLLLVWGHVTKALCAPFAHYVLGFSWNDAMFATSIANCRGFNALIVGTVGYNNGEGVFGPVMFALCVMFSVISSCEAGVFCRVFHNREQKRLLLEQKDVPTPIVGDQDTDEEHKVVIRPFWKDDTNEILRNNVHFVVPEDDLQAFRSMVPTLEGSDGYMFSGKAGVDVALELLHNGAPAGQHFQFSRYDAIEFMTVLLRKRFIEYFMCSGVVPADLQQEEFFDDGLVFYSFTFDDVPEHFYSNTERTNVVTKTEVTTTTTTSVQTVFNTDRIERYKALKASGALMQAFEMASDPHDEGVEERLAHKSERDHAVEEAKKHHRAHLSVSSVVSRSKSSGGSGSKGSRSSPAAAARRVRMSLGASPYTQNRSPRAAARMAAFAEPMDGAPSSAVTVDITDDVTVPAVSPSAQVAAHPINGIKPEESVV